MSRPMGISNTRRITRIRYYYVLTTTKLLRIAYTNVSNGFFIFIFFQSWIEGPKVMIHARVIFYIFFFWGGEVCRINRVDVLLSRTPLVRSAACTKFWLNIITREYDARLTTRVRVSRYNILLISGALLFVTGARIFMFNKRAPCYYCVWIQFTKLSSFGTHPRAFSEIHLIVCVCVCVCII